MIQSGAISIFWCGNYHCFEPHKRASSVKRELRQTETFLHQEKPAALNHTDGEPEQTDNLTCGDGIVPRKIFSDCKIYNCQLPIP